MPQILGLAHPGRPWAGSPHVFLLRLIPSILALAAAPRAWLPQQEQGFFHHALPCRVPLLRRARSSPGTFRNERKPLLLEMSAEKAAAAAVRGRMEVWGRVFGVSWELEALLPPVRTVGALMGFFGVSLLWLSAESFGKGQPGVCSLLCWGSGGMGSGQPFHEGGSSGEQQNPPGNTRGCNPKRCCREGSVQWDFWGEVQQGEGELRLQSSSAQGQGMGLTPPGETQPCTLQVPWGNKSRVPKSQSSPLGSCPGISP